MAGGAVADDMCNQNLFPAFHITGERGWINDPNGLVEFNGEYHVFFQYYPDDCQWGPMHWGHVKSKDLMHWERLPVALKPDENEDGCFSGSAIVWNGQLWLLYTGFKQNEGGEAVRQLQCLASSRDGVHFIKHGIVIGEKELPADYCPWDFRDPKLFRRDDKFYCVVAAKKRGGGGRVLLFESEDLFGWKFVCDLFGRDGKGLMIECPDLRDDMGLLMYSEQFYPAEGRKFLNVHSSLYRFGALDVCKGYRAESDGEIIDYGFDFYAPQTFTQTPVMIGWLDMWDRANPTKQFGFAGQLTVPRCLTRKGTKLLQRPVYDKKAVRSEENFTTLSDHLLIGAVKVQAKDLSDFSIHLRKAGENETLFELRDEEWVFDRSRSGTPISGAEKDADSLAGIRRMPFERSEETEIEIVSDQFSLEIFVNGISMSNVICPPLGADGLELSISARSCQYTRYEIK